MASAPSSTAIFKPSVGAWPDPGGGDVWSGVGVGGVWPNPGANVSSEASMRTAPERAHCENRRRSDASSGHRDGFIFPRFQSGVPRTSAHVAGHDIQDAWIRRGRPSVKQHSANFDGEENNTRSSAAVRNITVVLWNWGLTCTLRVKLWMKTHGR